MGAERPAECRVTNVLISNNQSDLSQKHQIRPFGYLEISGEAVREQYEVGVWISVLQWLERLDAMTAVLSQLAWLLAVLLAAGVAVVIGNTIRLDVQNRREEIEVIALVGLLGAWLTVAQHLRRIDP